MATRPIDEKIVVMKLDNSDFKQKAIETTGLFGKLRDSLNKIPGVNLGKTSQELSSIGSETRKINMEGLSNSVRGVATQFSAMGAVAFSVLQNLTNRAVNAGISLGKSLSLDQVTAGFSEYELKMSSIQTILANTSKHGTTLDDVSKSLNELNNYADKTIYNFGDMTRNIGLFTNAGLKLEESTSMIKGFSNAAAASGAGSEEASRAAYQLSQALSAGYIMQMDWMSLSNAGMGNDNMKRDLIALGQAMGTLNKDSEYTISNWKEMLSDEKWLTSEVMSTYLQAMAGDLDKATLKTLGLSDAQTEMLLTNAKVGEESATMVRTFTGLMGGIKEAIGSGWATSFEQIFGDFEEATVLWTKLNNSIGGFFEESAKSRNEMLKAISDQGGFLNVFEGVENAVKPVMQIFDAMGIAFKRVFPPASVNQLVKITETFKEFTAGLALGTGTFAKVTTIFQGIFSIFSTVWEITKRLASAFVQLIPPGTGKGLLDFAVKVAELAISFNESVKQGNGLTRFIEGLGSVLGTIGGAVASAIGSIVNFGGSLKENIGSAVDWVVEKLRPVGQFLKEAFGGIGGDDILGAGTLVGVFAIVKKIMDFFDSADFGGMLDSVKDVFEGVGDAVNAFATGIKYVNLILIAVALATLAGALKTLEGISTEDIAKGITALAVSLGVMMAGMMVISKFNLVGGIGASVTIIALATAVTIMASALKKISDLSPTELATGIGGLVGVTAALALAVIAISKWGGKIKTSSLQLIALAGAVYILAEAIQTMSAIDPGRLWSSIGALTVIFAGIAAFLLVVDKSKFRPSSAAGVLIVAGAIHVMVNAIEKIALIDYESLAKGLGSIAIILAEVVLFSKLASGPNLAIASVGLLLMAGAITALMGPITALGQMTWTELLKGLGGMALAMVAVAGAAYLLTGSIAGAAGLVVMAAGLNLLIGPIERFAAMTWGEMLKGFVGLAGGLALIAGVSMLLTPAIVPMIGFGAALGIMGIAIMAAGAGMALFGTGLAALATLTAVSITAIVSSLALLLSGLTTLIPATVEFIVTLGLALVDGLMALVPPVANAVFELVVALLDVITTHLPRLLELGIELIVQLIEGISSMIDKLVDAGLELIITFIYTLSDAIRDNGPVLISAVLELLGEIILLVIEAGVQMVDALVGWIPGVEKVSGLIGENAEKYIRENFGAREAGLDKGREFSQALESTKNESAASGKKVAEAGKKELNSIDTTGLGVAFGNNFASGIGSTQNNIKRAAENMAATAYNGIRNHLEIRSPSKKTDKLGQETGTGFAKGIAKKKKDAEAAAKKTAKAAQDAFTEKMADAKYKFDMEEISATQYITELNKIKKAYGKIPANVRKVNTEIKKVQEKADKEREEAFKKRMDAEKKAIDDRKYHNNMSLMQELAAWQKILNQYKKGTEERSQADREVYRIKNEINTKLLDLNEEYLAKVKDANQQLIDGEKALRDEYEQTVNDRAKSLAGFSGLFEKVNEMSEVSGQELIDNLKGQNKLFERWSSNIWALSTKGLDKGLIDELREMGPQAAMEIEALNNMTKEQLTEYNKEWQTKHQMARNSAVSELDALKKETETKIKELHAQTAKQLSEYQKTWVKSINEIKNWTKEGFVGLNKSMSDIGEDSIKGLMKGLANMEGDLKKQAKGIADGIAATIRKALQVKSPSRVTEAIGEFAGEGLGVGLANRTGMVYDNAKDLANTASDTINDIVSGFQMDAGDNELHFKAIIDYDSIDPNRLGGLNLLAIQPDTSFVNNSLASVKSPYRQNGDNSNRNDKSNTGNNNDVGNNTPKQPVVIQLPLDGRVIAELTYEDIGDLLAGQSNLDFAMK